jgi:nucleoid DNA-binding protein
VNKSELVIKLAKKTGMSQREAKDCVDVLFATESKKGIIATELDAGRRVQITGFGTFETRKRKARQGRNPRTGETIKIAAAKVPAFSAGKALKERVRK